MGDDHAGVDSFAIRSSHVSAMEGLGKDAAIGVLAGRDGTLWVANSGSLDSIAGGRVSSIPTGRGLPGSQVTSLLEDRSGNMWVGVDDGLYLFEQGRFRRLPEPDGRPLGLVVGITEDIHGNIWAHAQQSAKLVASAIPGSRAASFTSDASGANSRRSAGRIWIGTLTDLFCFVLVHDFTVSPSNPGSLKSSSSRRPSFRYEDGSSDASGHLQRMTTGTFSL